MRSLILLVFITQVLNSESYGQRVFLQINGFNKVRFIVADPLGRRTGVDSKTSELSGGQKLIEEIPNANYSTQSVGSLDPDDPGTSSIEFFYSFDSPQSDGIYTIQVAGDELSKFSLYINALGQDTLLTQNARFNVKDIPIEKDSVITYRLTYNGPPGSLLRLVKVVTANSLLQDVSAMRKLDWITTETVLDKYRGLITTYGAYFEQSNYEAARGTLNNMLQELAIDSGSTITGDAYKLLQVDVEQLLGELPSSPPQTPISPYSLFATHSLWLEQNAKVFSGDIGVNLVGDAPFLDSQVELSVGIGVTTAASSSIKANRVKVKQGATVSGDVSYNELENNGTIAGTLHTPLSLPLVAALPEFKSATPGSLNIEVPQNGTQTLQPGSYGDIIVRRNGRLTFTGGIYHFNSITTGDDVFLLFQTPSEVRVGGKFDSGEGNAIGPEDTTSLSAREVVFHVGGINGSNGNLGATPKAAKIGLANRVNANFYVPNGTLWIRQNTEATGAFIGKDVDVGIGVKVWLRSAF